MTRPKRSRAGPEPPLPDLAPGTEAWALIRLAEPDARGRRAVVGAARGVVVAIGWDHDVEIRAADGPCQALVGTVVPIDRADLYRCDDAGDRQRFGEVWRKYAK